MSYPSIDEFKQSLSTQPLETIVEKYVFGGIPFVFRDRPSAFELLQSHLCKELNLTKDKLAVVGSAKIGFSLSPDTFPRRFSNESDIDVVVVDEILFDKIWITLLSWHYPRRLSILGGIDGDWQRGRRNDLYWGWFVPDKIRYDGLSFPDVLRPLRDISSQWFSAFRSLSRYREFAGRDVTGRLYRTWGHALLYHVDGLEQIKKGVQS